MISALKVAYMFLVAFSAVMIGVSLVYMTGFIAGGFVGIWFTVMIYCGAQIMLVDRQDNSSDRIQRDYQEMLEGSKPKRKRKRRARF